MLFRTTICCLAAGGLLALAACSTVSGGGGSYASAYIQPDAADYGPFKDGEFDIPAVPIEKIDERYWRQTVDYRGPERPGTIIVDTPNRFLYYVEPGGKAIRYGIGVGKAGFAWEGDAYVAWKQPWPKWTPPKEMVARSPKLRKYGEDGMDGGLENPLGARALYLFSPAGKDTLYRIHGSPEWRSIGHAVSSGCIRMLNQDIVDLYDRVAVGRQAKVVVKQADDGTS